MVRSGNLILCQFRLSPGMTRFEVQHPPQKGFSLTGIVSKQGQLKAGLRVARIGPNSRLCQPARLLDITLLGQRLTGIQQRLGLHPLVLCISKALQIRSGSRHTQ